MPCFVGLPPSDLLSFSFRHIDLRSNNRFHFDGWDISKSNYRNYLRVFLQTLQNLSHLKWYEVHQNRSPALRSHPIKWDQTTEPNGFTCLNPQLQAHDAYQFTLTANEHGRVHGFAIDSTFYVVWLDPHHKLYSEK